jgi:hypothetical protein
VCLLVLSLDRDDDGTAALLLNVRAQEFCGVGRAWFDLTSLADLGQQASAYPLPPGHSVSLAGGYWKREGGGLEQEHLFISVSPIGLRGMVEVHVRVAEPPLDDASRPRHSLTTVLYAPYGVLQRFGADIRSLVDGTIAEARLHGQDNPTYPG